MNGSSLGSGPVMPPVVVGPDEQFPLLANYTPAGTFDELLGADGQVRPHYTHLLQHLEQLGLAELKRRVETSRRLVHEQGITYNVYGDLRGMERPWQIDPIPLLLAESDWRRLEAGLAQRARLINLILADCYGSQELIRRGWLPPALVFAQREFLRPCHGFRVPQDSPLVLYAADLGRAPDGRWWVISDRTQIPTGAGYALANRLVTSRVLPEPFRDENVQRLAGFFRQLQATLGQLARRRTGDPRVVLLTPGPLNETYFEQAWLARYLGYMLVEGEDLAVRDDRVFLKTLSGLEPVDVILRRVDDEFCDPLELRNDSMLGVPGLVEAVRAGNVAIANALGSGLLQSPAFASFLPGLCQHLLGEELQLPSVATWWCGQTQARAYVLEHLEKLFVKPAFGSRLPRTAPGPERSAAEREKLRQAIAFQPHLFVGQEWVELSTAPCWGEGAVVSRAVGLRAYVVATEQGFSVMPGGLARVAADGGRRSISMQHGGSSKDIWVLSARPVEEVTLLHSSKQSTPLRRVGNNLPSRMADNFFWLGRYAERADATARLLRSVLARLNPESAGSAWPVLAPMLKALQAHGHLEFGEENQDVRQHVESLEAALLDAIVDAQRPGSLRYLADQLQRLAMLVRHRTSNDLWRALSQLDDRLTPPAVDHPLLAGEAVGILNQTLLGLAAFQGMARENMTRAHGWRFLDMGCRIERSIHLSVFLEAALHSSEADNLSVLEAVLEVCDSTITYRSRYNLLAEIVTVYDLVLLDDTNPRSLLFQLNQLVKHVERLPRERDSALPSSIERLLFGCVNRLRLLDPRSLGQARPNFHEGETGEVLRASLLDLPRLSDEIAVNYFAHSTISRTGRSE